MKLRKVLAFCMALCLVAVQMPFTAMGADSASASVMRMAGTEGNVSVSTENGRSLTVREDMKLYSGYTLNTELASYAYVSLDGTKAVKMDALSEVSVRKSGRELELLVNSGKLFFDVTAPLEQDETLNIRTSTMVTGIRGTAGVVEVGEQVSSIYLLDGEVELLARDPVSGEVRGVKVRAGQKATIVTGEDANGREYTRVFVTELTAEEIAGFAAKEVLEDAALQERIRNASGLDVEQIIMGAEDQLARDQEEAARLIEERRNQQRTEGEQESDSVDPVFSGEDGVDPENMQEGGQGNEGGGPGVTDPAGPGESSSGGGSSESEPSGGSEGPGEPTTESGGATEPTSGGGGETEPTTETGPSEPSSEGGGETEPTTETGPSEPSSESGGETEPTTETGPSEPSSESGGETEPTTETGPSEPSSEGGGETEPTTGSGPSEPTTGVSKTLNIKLDDITSGTWNSTLVDTLAANDEVILEYDSSEGSGTDLPQAIISEDLTIPPGKTLKVNIPVAVDSGKTLTVEGTMNVTTGFTNEGTIVNKGMNTFVIEENAFFMNTGNFQNDGRLVNYGEFRTMEGVRNPEFSNTGTIENYGEFESVMMDPYNADVQIGSFVNQGKVKNFGSISISYLNGSTPGNVAGWEWGEGGRLLLNYLNEYNNGYQTQFDSLCELVIGQEPVRALRGGKNGPEGTRQVAVARDFQTVLKQDSFIGFELMESVTVSGNLAIGESRTVYLYLNNKTLTMDGGSIINDCYLEIYGGSFNDDGNGQGFVHGINTDRVIRNKTQGDGYGVVMKNVDVKLESSAGGPGSCAFENKGRLQLIGEAGQTTTCRFINNEEEGWGFYNNTEGSATVHSGKANVAVEFQALTSGYTANLDDNIYPEEANGQGVIRRVELSPLTELRFEISEASPSNASYFLEWPPAISTDVNATPLPGTDDTHSTGAGGNQIATVSNADWESAEHNNAEAQAGGQQDEASSKNQTSGSLNNLIWKKEEQDEKK